MSLLLQRRGTTTRHNFSFFLRMVLCVFCYCGVSWVSELSLVYASVFFLYKDIEMLSFVSWVATNLFGSDRKRSLHTYAFLSIPVPPSRLFVRVLCCWHRPHEYTCWDTANIGRIALLVFFVTASWWWLYGVVSVGCEGTLNFYPLVGKWTT